MSWFSDLMDRWELKQAYNWGKGRAKTKLFVFRSLQAKFPEIPVNELYQLTILNGSRFTKWEAKSIVNGPDEEVLASYGITLPKVELPYPEGEETLCLRRVVKCMLIHETTQYLLRNGVSHPMDIHEAWRAVDDTISLDI